MVNREQRRALKRETAAQIPGAGPDQELSRRLMGAILFSAQKECDCRACKLLRKVLPQMSEGLMDEEDLDEDNDS